MILQTQTLSDTAWARYFPTLALMAQFFKMMITILTSSLREWEDVGSSWLQRRILRLLVSVM